MAPRTLASLAHALSVAPDLDAALVALGEGLADLDRTAQIALLRYDGRRDLLTERLQPVDAGIERGEIDATFDHLPAAVRTPISTGGQFIDVTEQAHEFARLFGFRAMAEEAFLSLRGVRFDGSLIALIAVYEGKKFFGTRATERVAPAVALFELAFARFAEKEAREEAVRTLEDVTQRVHEEYIRKLGAMEHELFQTKEHVARGAGADPERVLALEQQLAKSIEDLRRTTRRAEAVEHQVQAAVGQLEQAHIELHRRSDSLRAKTRTLYLLDRVLSIDAENDDPRQLVDGLLALVGNDMQAQRCSLMLRAPEPDMLFLAAARGVAPNVVEGARTRIGQGVAGVVAANREPILVEDVTEAHGHPLLKDAYFTAGSFISFPLVYHDELVGVVNLTNRAQQGVFLEEDIERVKLLGLVISLVASHARLPERLIESIGAS
jgi:hypothetical protein